MSDSQKQLDGVLESASELANSLTTAIAKVNTVDDAKAIALEAVGRFRDLKEMLAVIGTRIETTKLLSYALPFVPAKYQPLAKLLGIIISMYGAGAGSMLAIDKPDAVNVTVPAEVTAATDAKLAEVSKQLEAASAIIAANEAAQKEQAARMAAAAEETKKIVAELNAKRWVTYGKTADGKSVPLMEFGGK